jgi:hypothetical protein
MCLDRVYAKVYKPTPLIQSGWKAFDTGSKGGLLFQQQSLNGSHSVPLDTWIKAEAPGGKIIGPGENYPAGFHIYEDETEIKYESWKPRRVYYRFAHTRGIQNSKTVVLATEMFVPSEPDDWPPL